jgi:uncharacterized membrane protein YkoI
VLAVSLCSVAPGYLDHRFLNTTREKTMEKRKLAMWLGGGVLVAAVAGGATAVAGGFGGDEHVTGPDADKAAAAALASTGGGKVAGVEHDEDNGAAWEVEITKPDGSTVDVALDSAFKVVGSEAGDDDGKDEDGKGDDDQAEGDEQEGAGDNADDPQVTGPEADQAKAAALAETGGGTVGSVQRDDSTGWEVEITKPDGSTVDVSLDAAYKVLGVDAETGDTTGAGAE